MQTLAAAEPGRPRGRRPSSPGTGPGSVAAFGSQGPDQSWAPQGISSARIKWMSTPNCSRVTWRSRNSTLMLCVSLSVDVNSFM